jgi:hypothetical protein
MRSRPPTRTKKRPSVRVRRKPTSFARVRNPRRRNSPLPIATPAAVTAAVLPIASPAAALVVRRKPPSFASVRNSRGAVALSPPPIASPVAALVVFAGTTFLSSMLTLSSFSSTAAVVSISSVTLQFPRVLTAAPQLLGQIPQPSSSFDSSPIASRRLRRYHLPLLHPDPVFILLR